jgi:uncharacterized membrane protein
MKKDKGQAQLGLFLSLVVTLFVIGLIVMIFAIMGTELRDNTYDSTTSSYVAELHQTNTSVTKTFQLNASTNYALRNAVCTVVSVYNTSSPHALISSGNYTSWSNCTIRPSTATAPYANASWLVNYTAVWDKDNTATYVMNDTVVALSGSVDFFDLFVVIGAMVVLIALVVLIVVAIKGSNIMGASKGTSGASIGTA